MHICRWFALVLVSAVLMAQDSTPTITGSGFRLDFQSDGRHQVLHQAGGGLLPQYADVAHTTLVLDGVVFSTIAGTLTPTAQVAGLRSVTTIFGDLGGLSVDLEQVVTILADGLIERRWTARNTGGNQFSAARLLFGGDTRYAGSDLGRGVFDPTLGMVYLVAANPANGGIRGLYPHPSTPSSGYQEGAPASITTALTLGTALPSTFNGKVHDTAFAMSWDVRNFFPGNQWTIVAYERFNQPGLIQVLPPATVQAAPGWNVDVPYRVINFSSVSSADLVVGLDSRQGWPATLVDTSLAVDPLSIATATAAIRMPAARGLERAEALTVQVFSGDTRLAAETAAVFCGGDPYDTNPGNLQEIQGLPGGPVAMGDPIVLTLHFTDPLSLALGDLVVGLSDGTSITIASFTDRLEVAGSATAATGGTGLTVTSVSLVPSLPRFPARLTDRIGNLITPSVPFALPAPPAEADIVIPLELTQGDNAAFNLVAVSSGRGRNLLRGEAGRIAGEILGNPRLNRGDDPVARFLRLFRFDAGTQTYSEPLPDIVPAYTGGQALDGAAWVVTRVPLFLNHRVPATQREQHIPLAPGWNLVGVGPLDNFTSTPSTAYDWFNEVQLEIATSLTAADWTIADAATRQAVFAPISSVDPLDQRPYRFTGGSYTRADVLTCGIGYWVRNNATAQAFRLRVIPASLSIPTPKAATTVSTGHYHGPLRDPGAVPQPPTISSVGSADDGGGGCGGGGLAVIVGGLALVALRKRRGHAHQG